MGYGAGPGVRASMLDGMNRHVALECALVVVAIIATACEADGAATGAGGVSGAGGSRAGAARPEVGPGAPGPGPAGAGRGARLEVAAAPRQGSAPLVVRFTGRLIGDGEGAAAPRCPSVAWSFGDGPPQIEALRCGDGAPTYAAVHEYERPGAYDASFRLLGTAVQPSAAIQVLVVGPTVTPAPEGRLGFPPAVIFATPMTAAATIATPVAEVMATPRPADTASPPQIPGRAAGPTTPVPVLPADLLYLSRGALRRLPASGGAPDDLVAGDGVTAFAVSSLGDVAYVQDRELKLRLPGGEPPFVLLDDGGAPAPVWSPDGRRLAWGDGEISVYEVAGGRRGALPGAGKPLAWSRDAGRLLVAAPGGEMALIAADGSDVTPLPVAPGRQAGWLADRDVVWLAGPGLRLLTLDDPLQLTRLAPESAAVGPVFLRPDRTLLAIVAGSSGAGAEAKAVDLKRDTLSLATVGPGILLANGDAFAWAPDGRTGAVVGPKGVSLVDTVSGGRVRILDEAAASPAWAVAAPPAGGN